MDGAGASGPYPAVAGSRRGARGTGARGGVWGGEAEGERGGEGRPSPPGRPTALHPHPPPPHPADATPRRVGGPLR
ncbi:hypothetical protein C9994_15655 [Marivirga lumbricoides]|uniref:Uncharacterized protein n=1 Tax=Marivirga lumbricoides TaxID=1046115 RepID=A0A2T4DC42_9BACT|nr:hypothetical protein C9994_15655 [Marivirga lumbricoides]